MIDIFDQLLEVNRSEIACHECDKIFMQQRIDQLFCSKKCRLSNRVEIARERANKWAKYNKEKHRINRQNWKKNNPTKRDLSNKKSYLKQTYGITLEQYIQLKTDQDYKCAICSKKSILHIDHCHRTGRIRALLCANCNRLLGMAKEDIAILQSSINYLKKWSTCHPA